jgi:metal-responsive CopG/Arc/MetJ family transcriptional regulator
MILDENLMREVDKNIKTAGMSCSEFTRKALRKAFDVIRGKELAE